LLILFSSAAEAQNITCKGQVVDTLGTGIPYAVIQVKGKQQGTYSNEQGAFSISVAESDILIFYCAGYEKREILAKNWHFSTVKLQEHDNLLNEVTISSKKNRLRHGQLGKRSKRYGDASFGPGYEMGLYFSCSEIANGRLSKIYLYVRDKGTAINKFRVHVYEADTITRLPIRDITDSNLIVHATKGEEWMEIDVTNKSIRIRNGMIISMEWLKGYGNNNTRAKVLEEDLVGYEGQMLGLTDRNDWQYQYTNNMFLNKHSTSLVPLTPMIYCTYAY
jgi:hypothetical protein